mmetsp:Transcript_49293/g.98542  ORF Transcript_49293/g.98542 Transcript_49293/m.98542 type:complete len:170 (+) Transcript_49293:121-630(+)
MAGDVPFSASVPKDDLRPNSKGEASEEAGSAEGGQQGLQEKATVEAVLTAVYTLFEAFQNSDAEAFKSIVDKGARFVRTGYTEDDKPDVTSYTPEYFIDTLKKVKKGTLSEVIEEPFVQTRDNLIAHVWCRYRLYVSEQPKHSGVKSIQLRRSVHGWKVVDVLDTIDSS